MPSQAPASGADDARWVRTSDPSTAATMNTVPPRRYSAEIAPGSPIRRRIQVARSSKACIWMSRSSDAPANATRYASWSRLVSAMFPTRARPTITTAFSGRRCPKTAYAANCAVAPDERAEHEDVVDLLHGELPPPPRDVQVRLRRALGREPERLARGMPSMNAQPARTGMRRPANRAPMRCVLQRPQPTFGPTRPTAMPSRATEHEPVGPRRIAVHPGRVVHGPGKHQDEDEHQDEGQPALRGPPQPPRGHRFVAHRARASASDRSGSSVYIVSSYSARAWRRARERWRCASRPAASGAGANAATSRWTTTVPMPRARSVASGRMNDGSCVARDHDRGHAAPQPADARDEGLVQGRAAVGLHGGEQLEDLEPLARPAVRGQDGEPVTVDGEADGPVLGDGLVGDGRGRPHRDLGGRLVALAGGEPLVEVQEEPRVRGLLQLELLDLDLARAGRAPPVDPVHRVARGVRPDGRRQGRGLQGPFRRRMGALDVGRRQPPQGQRLDPRVDDQRDPVAHAGRGLEEPERVAGPDLERLDPEVAAPREGRADEPRALVTPAEGDRPARQAAGQAGRVVDLQPRLRPAGRCCAACTSPAAGRRRGRSAGSRRTPPPGPSGRGGSGRSCRRPRAGRGRRGRTGTASPVENAATTRTTTRVISWSRRSTVVGPPGAGRGPAPSARGRGWAGPREGRRPGGRPRSGWTRGARGRRARR